MKTKKVSSSIASRFPDTEQEFLLAETIGDIFTKRLDLGKYWCHENGWYRDNEHSHIKFDKIEPEREGDL